MFPLSNINTFNVSNFWEKLESSNKRPTYCSGVELIEYKDYKKIFENQKIILALIAEIYFGKVCIIKNAFSKEFINDVKKNFADFIKSNKSSFFQMKEECPNFHRVIDEEVTKLYSFKAIKHSAYFFPWNKDEYNLFPTINERWRMIKFLGGRTFNEFEGNTPKDGICDRIQVLRYPTGGLLEAHQDPYHNQRTFISIYMSKRANNGDYQSGGFYVVGAEGQKIDVEPYIDQGDLGFGYATISHGVSKINNDKKIDFEDRNVGRWFLGLYSNDSDEKKERITASPSAPK